MSVLDWSPAGLSADPVPGDPGVVRRGGNDYVEVASAIASARTTLASLELGAYVVSQAVDAIQSTATEVATSISRAQGRYEATGEALVTYADALSTAQTEARGALADATDAAWITEDARDSQRRYLRLAHDASDPQTALRYEQVADDHGISASIAESAFNSAHARIGAAATSRDRAADQAIVAIDNTTSSDSLGDTWWDDWGKDALAILTDVAGWVSTIAGILAIVVCWIPVIGQALAGALLLVAGIAAIVNAIANVVLAFDGERSREEAGLSVLGAALGFVGGGVLSKIVGRLLKSRRGTDQYVVGRPLKSRELLRLKPRDITRWIKDLRAPIPAPYQGQYVYRVYGAGSDPVGRSWSLGDPRGFANPRMQLGLPDTNSMSAVVIARMRDPGAVETIRHGLPFDGKLGGAAEYVMRKDFEPNLVFDQFKIEMWVP